MTTYNNKKSRKNQIIYTGSAPCGTGKSHTMRDIIEFSDKNCLIVLPTIDLIKEQEQQLGNYNFTDSRSIHSEDELAGTVKQRLTEYFIHAPDHGQVLFITWESYKTLGSIPRRDNWKIFIDEIPQIDRYGKIRLKYNPQVLTNILTVVPVGNGLGMLVPTKQSNIKNVVHDGIKEDDSYKSFDDLLYDVYSENFDVFVNVEKWEQMANGSQEEGSYVPYLSMMNPNLFNRVTLMGANIDFSILYHWFKNHYNVTFQRNRILCNRLKQPFDYKGKIVADYFFDYGIWSKTKMKKLKTEMDSKLCDELKSNEFLLCTNVDTLDKTGFNAGQWSVEGLEGCCKVPTVVKGSNSYIKYETVVYLPALNRDSVHLGMLNNLGISPDVVMVATGYENLYQTLLRSALRDNKFNGTVRLICPTSREIDFLEHVMNCKIPRKQIADKEYHEIDSNFVIWAAKGGHNEISIGKFKHVIDEIKEQGFVEKKKSNLIQMGLTESQWKRNLNKFEDELKTNGIEIVTANLSKSENKKKDYTFYVYNFDKFNKFVHP